MKKKVNLVGILDYRPRRVLARILIPRYYSIQQEALLAAVDVLEDRGPTLGRPLVDTLQGSTHGNMKELRPPSEGDTSGVICF
jgi:hypothetical protein